MFLLKIFQKLWNSNLSFSFRYPVDYKTLGLIDYPFLITHPMDLTTIKKKIKRNSYKTVNEYKADL